MPMNKRRFLKSAAALAFARTAPGWAAAPSDILLDVRQTGLRLTPEGPESQVLRYLWPEPLPVLRVKQGQDVALRVRNGLAEPTSFQLCGLRGHGSLDDPAESAGVAIAPGAEALVRFKPGASGTAWFRPRLGPADQASRGLSGVLIVDPAEPTPVDQDLVCFLQDWLLDGKGQIAGASPTPAGPVSIITASKKPIPAELTFRPGARLRLRLVNGSTRRLMVVACEGARPMVVAIDGQPSELFQPTRDTVPIGPGGRFDTLLDLPRDAGKSVRLILRGSERVNGVIEPDRPIWTMTTDGPPADARPPIMPLPPNPALPTRIALEASKRADLTIDTGPAGWTVNGTGGVAWPKQPVLRVKQGDAVTLGFINASKALVPLSLYGQAMRLLHPADDGWEPYWRDTLLLPPGSRNHVAFVADQPGRWPIESGFNDQASAGLRCWFEIV